MKVQLTVILSFIQIFLFAGSTSFTVDSTNYLIGEQAEFTLTYEGTPGVNWPIFGDSLTDELEIIEVSSIDTIATGKYTQKILITSWDSGYFVVPPIKVSESQSAPLLLRFNTVDINPQADFEPIKEQMNTPFIFAEIKELVLWSLLVIVILIAAFFTGRYFYLKNKNKPQPEEIIPEIPVMEILWERYHILAESKIWEKGEEKAFHVELSLILRKFLEFKFRIKALEETTNNINHQLNSIGLDRKLREEVSHILNFSDMVKFAKQTGVFTQHENAINLLKEILEIHKEEKEIG